jgi:hypothetical protein
LEESGQLHAIAALPPGEIAPDTDWIEGWLGTRAGLDVVERRKSCTYRDSNSDPSAIQPTANRYA